jgi:NAD+ kinase
MSQYKTIGLTRNIHADMGDTLQKLYEHLLTEGYEVVLGRSCDGWVSSEGAQYHALDDFSQKIDLAIVLGGDGTLLTAARALSDKGVPIIGINLGRLGFLVDVSTQGTMLEQVDAILEGDCHEEERFLLEGRVMRNGECIAKECALNDVILHNRKEVRMIEYSVSIDGRHVNHDRADGLIVATPTGSTAYALSSGGPILYPTLQAISLVPICPHTLSHRPLVVNADSLISLQIDPNCDITAQVTFDGQGNQQLQAGDSVEIRRKTKGIKLLHPKDYDFYSVLRAKLRWGDKLTR